MSDDRITLCECEGGGWCRRHRVNKTDHFAMLCRSNPDYFRYWEEGHGPAIAGRPGDGRCKIAPYIRPRGLGDSVARFLRWFGVDLVVKWIIGSRSPESDPLEPAGDCGCPERQAGLNEAFPFTATINKDSA